MHDLRQLTLDYIAAFDQRNVEALSALLHDDIVLEDPAGRFAGKATVLKYISGIFDAIKDLSFSAQEIIVESPRSVIEFRLVLDGKVLVGTDVIEWRDGQLAVLRAYLYEKA